jgi:L-seryl-tRNA(Ser) seleniumtransferase
MTGGGSLPGEEIPSAGIRLDGDVAAGLREASIPVIARVRDQATFIDLRTVHPDDDTLVANAIASVI